MKQSSNIFMKLIGNFFGVLLILFVIFGITSLGKFLYFPSKTKAVLPEYSVTEKFTKTIERAMETGHFHILDETVYSDEENAPMCLRCHGNFCHAKSKELRSFYNMHSFYLTCETCHIRKGEVEEVSFQWFDDKTGEVVKEPKGKDGSYGAKIVPVKDGERLDKFPKEKLALEYMKLEDTYTEEEKKKIQDELMKHVSEEAITCKECHKRDGYLDFSIVGYSQTRIKELTQLEIIKLIDEYKKFYLPTMFDPSVVRK